jgi:hypothetical protein
LALVKAGVPFDVAAALAPHERAAWLIILGELDGGRFDWKAMRWAKRD